MNSAPTRHPGRRALFAALAAFWAAGPAFQAPAIAQEKTVAFVLTPEQQCGEGEAGASPGSLIAQVEGGSCVLLASTDSGSLDGFFSLADSIEGRIPQPPEFFGFFRSARLGTTFMVPFAPPQGAEVAAAHLLNHLIVVWLLEEDGIAIAPIGDPIAHFLPPAPPPYFVGRVAGKVRYREPFTVEVAMTTEAHMIVVRQSGGIVAAATLKKVFAHPDRMTHAGVFLASGDLNRYPIWAQDQAEFRGVQSPAEVIIQGADPQPTDPAIARIERAGDEVRVYLR